MEGKNKKVVAGWDKVLLARNPKRFRSSDMIHILFDSFLELHGDRCHGDDKSVVSGIAFFDNIPVTVISQQKGKDMYDMEYRRYGMSMPEGYRKSLRLMKQAEKFNRPIICFVDTPGAFCGIEAEERGQGEAIARNLFEMSGIKVPILSIVVGEGGSGGALALAVANQVWMLENATYSILSPEGFASILWKDSKRANEAAEVMKITAEDLKNLNIVDQVIPEEEALTVDNMETVACRIRNDIIEFIKKYTAKTKEDIVSERYSRFRNM